MLRQAENNVRIEGILSEVDLEYGSFQKNNKAVECIRGTINILVHQPINGIPTDNEIPVHMFAAKYKNNGEPNPAYESIERIKNEYKSIAAVNGEEEADRIRITGGSIRMNEYFNQNQQLVSFPRINTSFVTKVRKEDFKPEATFTVEMVVANQGYKVDAEGNEVEPKVYEIKGIVPQFGEKVDIIPFVCSNENVINAVSTYWNENDTVKASGRLNFTSKTETFHEEVDFGEPIERQRTISVSEMIITGGSQTPLDGDFAFDVEEIRQALTERKERLEEQKKKDAEKKNGSKSAPASSFGGSLDLGF